MTMAIEHERLVFAKAGTDDIKAAPSPTPFTPAPQPEPATKPNTVPKVEPSPSSGRASMRPDATVRPSGEKVQNVTLP